MFGSKSKRLMRGVLGSMLCIVFATCAGLQPSTAAAADVRRDVRPVPPGWEPVSVGLVHRS